jgi:hypothetical protein
MFMTEATTIIAAATIIPGDRLVVRSAYGDKAHTITAVWGDGLVTIEAINTLGQTIERQARAATLIEVVATDGDR